MSQMPEMQTCNTCYGEADARAKRCPHCRASLKKFAWLGAVGPIVPLLLLLPVLFVPALMMQRVADRLHPEGQVPYTDQIKVISSRLAKGTSKEGPVLCVLGRIRNESATPWSNVVIQAEFRNKAGDLVDVGDNKPQHWLSAIMPEGEAAFKVRVPREFPEDEYASYTAHVISAQDARRTP